MNFWRKLFNRHKVPIEERRDCPVDDGRKSVSCMDVVQIIRDCVSSFKGSEGMVVVILEGYRLQIYLFDGIAHTSWGYNNHIFSTDLVGKTFLIEPPVELSISTYADPMLPIILQKEFEDNDIKIGKLWKLNPQAPDYEMMKILHENDISIRISFERVKQP